MILVVILIFHFVVNYCVHSNKLTSVVQTDKGPVQGEIRETIRRLISFSSFRGIRYGKAPTGYSRFKPPEEAEPWVEIFDATADGTPCPQIDSIQSGIFADEDCLNLNVYSPKINYNNTDKSLFSVMVWIYGGRFENGNTNIDTYGPDFLIENGVVVVAMNYRLGILGFLSLNHPDATGNAGLKDQQLALKWVQTNIKEFGGDPNSVTIFGDSAGAVAVDYHALADGSQGLFHRSISMSGSPFCLWGFSMVSQAEARAFRLGHLLGFNAANKEELLQQLYNQSAYDLVIAANKMTLADPPFKPTLEDSNIAGDTAFVSECSVNKYRSGNFSQVPSIIGFMASEALGFTEHALKAKDIIDETLQNFLQITEDDVLTFVLYSQDINFDALVALVALTNDTYQGILTILTDVLFVSGIDTKQKYLTRYGTAPVYYYRNSFAPYPSFHRYLDGININGAAHADDLAYCWHMSVLNFPTDPENSFVIMQDRITRMWTNFAKYSNPTPFGKLDLLLNISWPISGLEGLHLEINDEFSIGTRPIDHITERHQNIAKISLDKINGC